MNRAEVEQAYEIKDGIIRSPGKFEGEPVFVPAFWDAGLEGFATEDDGSVFLFELTPEDHAEWPELEGDAWLVLEESEQGFVYCQSYDHRPTIGGSDADICEEGCAGCDEACGDGYDDC